VSIRASLLRDRTEVQQHEETLELQSGLNRGTLALATGNVPSGNYTLRVTFQDQQGNAVAEFVDDVFVLNQAELENARKAVSAFQTQTALAASLPTLEIRFEWIDQFYQRTGVEDLTRLNGWWNDIVYLTAKLEQGEPAIFGNDAIKRYAHRSAIDNTLQPYSVFLPEAFDANTEYPLLVGLHGSGVDEQGEMAGWATAANALGYPLIAPKARGLSDYYTGASGEDVFECIEHFIQLFPNIRRDRIFLAGFSMGGYGTWHLGILKPEYFRGLIVLSGAMRSDILDGLDRIGRSNILVIHGDADLAVPVDGARRAVEKLKALDANVVYIEVPGGGHGDYWNEDLSAQVVAWIQKYSE
jgi:pimeloyl-ACP methyl ester carboxylesterase